MAPSLQHTAAPLSKECAGDGVGRWEWRTGWRQDSGPEVLLDSSNECFCPVFKNLTYFSGWKVSENWIKMLI